MTKRVLHTGVGRLGLAVLYCIWKAGGACAWQAGSWSLAPHPPWQSAALQVPPTTGRPSRACPGGLLAIFLFGRGCMLPDCREVVPRSVLIRLLRVVPRVVWLVWRAFHGLFSLFRGDFCGEKSVDNFWYIFRRVFG